MPAKLSRYMLRLIVLAVAIGGCAGLNTNYERNIVSTGLFKDAAEAHERAKAIIKGKTSCPEGLKK